MLPLLEGTVGKPVKDEVLDLKRRVAKLIDDLEDLQEQLRQERGRNESLQIATATLRRLLEPQYIALQAIFGELDLVSVGEPGAAGSPMDDPKRRLWQSKIDKFGDNLQGKMIRALLDHGSLTAPQLRVPMDCSLQSVYNTYNRLVKLGLVSSQGGKYSLREL